MKTRERERERRKGREGRKTQKRTAPLFSSLLLSGHLFFFCSILSPRELTLISSHRPCEARRQERAPRRSAGATARARRSPPTPRRPMLRRNATTSSPRSTRARSRRGCSSTAPRTWPWSRATRWSSRSTFRGQGESMISFFFSKRTSIETLARSTLSIFFRLHPRHPSSLPLHTSPQHQLGRARPHGDPLLRRPLRRRRPRSRAGRVPLQPCSEQQQAPEGRRPGDHQPARVDNRLGPRDGRAAAPLDRVERREDGGDLREGREGARGQGESVFFFLFCFSPLAAFVDCFFCSTCWKKKIEKIN